MKTKLAALALLFSLGMSAGPVLADDGHGGGKGLFIDRDVDTFAVLPQGVTNPEGITANPANGDIYVSTFVAPFKLLRYDRRGRLLGELDFGQPLLGLEFRNGKVYICNVGNFVGAPSKIQRVNADLTDLEDVAIMPSVGAPAPNFAVGNPDGSTDFITFGDNASVPNALVFDSKGTLYISDSFQGAVFKIANVAACNVATCVVNTLSHDGLLGVCTNQADEVVALDANGKVVAKLGEFRGINRDGTPDGLLFPASPVIVGNEIFVTNLAIALTAAVGDEPEEDVKLWTVSKMRLPH